jgi:hypothetical protein
VPDAIGVDWPKAYVGAWQHFPRELRQFVAWRVLQKQLELQEGPAGLVQWLYRGDPRLPSGASWTATADMIWPVLLDDARAWFTKRTIDGTPKDPVPETTVGSA